MIGGLVWWGLDLGRDASTQWPWGGDDWPAAYARKLGRRFTHESAAIEASGCVVDQWGFGSEACSLVAVADSVRFVVTGEVIDPLSLTVGADWPAKFAHFCQVLSLPGGEVGWFIAGWLGAR